MSPSKHQFFDVTFSIYQSGESKKEREKERKAPPTEDESHFIVTFDNYSSGFYRIASFDQHNVVGGERKHE